MLLRVSAVIVFIGLVFSTCKKEYSCEDCLPEPPVAVAGNDTVLHLPVDSLLLDGSASHDPDGKIVSHKWRKIEGPASIAISNASSSKTLAKGFTEGYYLFELEVTDDDGLSAKDTLLVEVNKAVAAPPVACAGPDTLIVLPVTEVVLNGTCSTDPNNDIISYQWKSISGPSSVNILSSEATQPLVSGLVEGIYFFQLKVTDASGFSSLDTVQVSVQRAVLCNRGKRIKFIANLTPIGHLSLARSRMAVATVANKVLFAGGNSGGATSVVDIFDITSQSWSSHKLSVPRFLSTAVVAGTKVFFAGGLTEGGVLPTNAVDIFDAASNTWTTAQLSIPGFSIGAASLGNKVFFAGGDGGGSALGRDRRVDIFDESTNLWSTASLSVKTRIGSAIAVNNKIYVSGGEMENHCNVAGGSNWYYPSPLMDVYDNTTSSWSTIQANEAKTFFAGIAVGDKIYRAGGVADSTCDPHPTCSVEIFDTKSGMSSFEYLSEETIWWNAGGENVVVKDNKLAFFRHDGSSNNFDVYDLTTKTWSVGTLPVKIYGAAIISVNNQIYLAGGYVNEALSNQVWKVEL